MSEEIPPQPPPDSSTPPSPPPAEPGAEGASGEPRKRRTTLVLDLPPPPSIFRRLLLGFGLLLGLAIVAGVIVVSVGYVKFSAGLPALPTVKDYRPPVLSEFWSDDRALSGEFYDERRKVIPYEKIPKKLVQAFIAAEDERFFDHPGFDPVGTVRAAFKTYVQRHKVQGGSTLTQQAAKAVLVSVELSKIGDEDVRAEARRRLSTKSLASDPEMVKAEEARIRAEIDSASRARLEEKLGFDDDKKDKSGEAKPAVQPKEAKAGAKDQKDLKETKAAKADKEAPKAAPLPAKGDEAGIHALALQRLTGKTLADDPERMRLEMLRVHAQMKAEAHARATEKTLRRKARELILALRLEKSLTKEEILYLYLNNVYLGHHSYGVQSAAENYFRKDVRDLSLGEISMLAGLPQAPSAFSPFAHPEAAKKRRHYVLRRMFEEGMISEAERKAAEAEDPKVYPVEDVFHELAPFFTEQVRRDIVSRYGNERLLKDGLKVYTAMNAENQRAAQVAMLDGLIRVDKRQGFTGPQAQLKTDAEKAAFEKRIAARLGDHKLTEGRFYVGYVERIQVEDNYAEVNIGGQKAKLPILGMRWAREPNPEKYYLASLITHVKQALKVGDVILVRAVPRSDLEKEAEDETGLKLLKLLPQDGPFLTLEQEPMLQGAIVSVDPQRGYVTAMIGGYDFDASEFNRAYQACRQPGSSFKPLIYSAALEQLEWPVNHLLVDAPVVFDDPDNQLRWKPANFGEDFKGDVLLRTALVNSMNVPAVKTLHAVGVKEAAEWAHNLGISTAINEDLSMALGGSCVHLAELVNVYATMNRFGKRFKGTYVRKVEDRFGRTLEDHTAVDDEFATFEERVAAGYSKLFDKPEQVMKPETAFIIDHLMREVVLHGTGAPAQRLGKPAAGKTGTTNDSFDTWFMGFTHDLVTGVWLGYDRYEHPLGKYETGGRASLPIWVDYMKSALADRPQPDFDDPPPGADIVWAYIDLDTGKRTAEKAKNSVKEPFVNGTEPKEEELAPGQVDPRMQGLYDNQ